MVSQKISEKKAVQIFRKISQLKIAVYGDFCLDVYWELDARGSEISVETGIRAQAVKSQKFYPGGAGNVAANIAALKPAKVTAIGIIGDDIWGKELRRILKEKNIDASKVIEGGKNFATYTYCKRILHGKELQRVDFGVFNKVNQEIREKLLQNIDWAISEYEALIINQQISGSVTDEVFIEKVNEIVQNYPEKLVVADSRHQSVSFKNVVLKLNEAEFKNSLGIKRDDFSRESLRLALKQLFSKTGRPIFLTRGEKGSAVFDGKNLQEIEAIPIFAPIDPVGGGDSALSMFCCSLAVGASLLEAAILANLAGAVVVQKLQQPGTASVAEIFRLGKEKGIIE